MNAVYFLNILMATMVIGRSIILSKDTDCRVGYTKDCPGKSCSDIYQRNSETRGFVGYFWVQTNEGDIIQVTLYSRIISFVHGEYT